jgi:single-stranded DNA-binding protein
MPALNKVQLIGNLGKDPETRYYTQVIARQMQMLDRKPDEQDVAAEGEEGE